VGERDVLSPADRSKVRQVLRTRSEGVPRTAAELEAALDDGRLTVRYQPVVDLRTGAVVAAEALARLADGSALVPPDLFIPLAEQSGLIRRVDMLVLEQALPQAARWRRQLGDRPFSIGVNISVADLAPELPAVVRALTSRHRVPGNALVLELTETVLSEMGAGHEQVLAEVAGLGCNVTMDDFGTGYSSLTHLRRFPVAGIKVDRQFVWDIEGGGRTGQIAQALVRFGRDLDLHVVAEGIETVEQLDALRAAGCSFGQGYLFAPPLSAADLTGYLSHPVGIPQPRSAS
jgi:EAL domain-containing protein (putative c-di-GMP-specific phosphodiesterase class I)